jgi:hypothetical protein
MRVEMSLAEMLMNAIVQGRVHGLQCTRSFGTKPGDEAKCFQALKEVIGKKLDAARLIAAEEGIRAAAQMRSEMSKKWFETGKLAGRIEMREEAARTHEAIWEPDDVAQMIRSLPDEPKKP